MTRIVVDTNVVLSALLWGGTPKQLFTYIIENGIPLLSSDELIQELTSTLNKPRLEKYVKLIGKSAQTLVEEFAKLVILVNPSELSPDIIRDPDDVIVLATAIAGKATHIITGDKDLLILNPYNNISIMKAGEFLQRVSPPNET